MPPSFVVGIDLGTTNCALAFAPVDGTAVTDFPIPQVQRPGEVADRSLLPSCLYLSSEHELPAGSAALPWGAESGCVAGECARWLGARTPGRLVVSAKSWLCHEGVDRTAAILPWGGLPDVAKLSPVEASRRLLAHLVAAWNHAHSEAPLAEQEVVITVPASFDEAARTLTVDAARQAGCVSLHLVEEPLAAFYDFIGQHPHDLSAALGGARLVLVVDVGGGTTDFTLVQSSPDGSVLRRIAVGDHLMLGGDNMDAALARQAEERLTSGGRKLAAASWSQLLQVTREAKERLLGDDAPERHGISVAGQGSRLVGNTLSTELLREETIRLVLDGFFPACGPEDAPQRASRVALQELGLPYAQDPAITRHLAAFLNLHAEAAWQALGRVRPGDALPRPDAILLNGGVFHSALLRDRLMELVSGWWPAQPPVRVLSHLSLDRAVARGAVHSGLVRRGRGRSIGGGAARAFYVGLAGEKPQAVCVIPRGQEEGQPVEVGGRSFVLALGQPVQFPLYSTTSDRVDRPGAVVEIGPEFHPLPPLHTVCRRGDGKPGNLPVHLAATSTELGTLELWCVAVETGERWRLEFNLRGPMGAPKDSVTEVLPDRWSEVSALVDHVYGKRGTPSTAKEAKQFTRELEKVLGSRDSWRLPPLRELWSLLLISAKARRRTPDHERAFYQMMGYSLRPGFGYPLDEWRCEQTFPLFREGVVHPTAGQPLWNDFWILWRRISGGLGAAQQQEIWNYLKPHLAGRVPATKSSTAKAKGHQPEGLDEMVRCAAALERIDPAEKSVLGGWIVQRLRNPETASGPWAWALGRLGARAPVYGSGHLTVPATQAEAWLRDLLKTDVRSVDGALFAVVQLARRTGDRSLDLDDAPRNQALAVLKSVDAPGDWLRKIEQVVEMDAADDAQALGDSLPLGLKLHGAG